MKAIAGVEAIKVQERQTIVWSSGSHFSVTSETEVLNIPGVKFLTQSAGTRIPYNINLLAVDFSPRCESFHNHFVFGRL